jgi:DNA-directed RNA polymerase subunit M/transcription elongation factor TFIIS
MSDTLCPKCNAKGHVVVKQSRTDKNVDLKYFECSACQSLWTNSSDIGLLSVEA